MRNVDCVFERTIAKKNPNPVVPGRPEFLIRDSNGNNRFFFGTPLRHVWFGGFLYGRTLKSGDIFVTRAGVNKQKPYKRENFITLDVIRPKGEPSWPINWGDPNTEDDRGIFRSALKKESEVISDLQQFFRKNSAPAPVGHYFDGSLWFILKFPPGKGTRRQQRKRITLAFQRARKAFPHLKLHLSVPPGV